MGVIPAMLALPSMFAVWKVMREGSLANEEKNQLLALFGGSALFFITMILPIQFQKQWLTIGLALEGLALILLFRKAPHPGP